MNTQQLISSKFGRRTTKRVKLVETNKVVVYTRVSSKGQEDNMSLGVQKEYIAAYVEKQGLQVLEHFGGTYESAKTDGRKEFDLMLKFIKNPRNGI